jgi:hypothetical protein
MREITLDSVGASPLEVGTSASDYSFLCIALGQDLITTCPSMGTDILER